MTFPSYVSAERQLLRAKDLADGRYHDGVDVQDMADAAGFSRAHFSREFKRAFGEPPHKYLLARRIERASALLRNTDWTVSEICLSVGLKSVGSFTSSFTNHVGVSPSAAYRHVRDRDHLMSLVSQVARQELARTMIDGQDAVVPTGDAATDAIARFEACGRGYIDFATGTPELFRTAFRATGCPPDTADHPDPALVLSTCVDGLVEAGLLDATRRMDAALIAWTAVHGLSSLLVDQMVELGLGIEPEEARQAVLDSVLRAVVNPGVVLPTD